MKLLIVTIALAISIFEGGAQAETGIERWERMQQQMAYEDMLDRQREKYKYDQLELEGIRNNQNRIIQPATCVSTPVTLPGGNTIIQTICK